MEATVERLTKQAEAGDAQAQRELNRQMERRNQKVKLVITEVSCAAIRWRDVRDRERQRERTSSVYFFPQGESVLENLFFRRNRPYEEYRKLLPEVFKQLGQPDTPIKGNVRWSRKAGCLMCPCSPGFVIKPFCATPTKHEGAENFKAQVDIWVTYAVVPAEG